MKQPLQIEKLLQDLQSIDPNVRKIAVEDLGRQTPAEPRTIQALYLAAQADTNEIVRSVAARFFRELTGADPPPSAFTLGVR